MLNPSDVLRLLTTSAPVRLEALPDTCGIYALWDHTGQVRYIGSTPRATEGFYTRIFNKHTAGSEGRSHKFTQAYCTGRMWRFCKLLHPAGSLVGQQADDAKLAKRLRTAFIRKHCRATIVEIGEEAIPGPYSAGLVSLERAVQALAPAAMRAWEGIRFPPLPEPVHLVDVLLLEFPTLVDAVGRQQSLYRRMSEDSGARS